MFNRLLMKPIAIDPEFRELRTDIQEAGFRTMIYLIGAIFFVGYFLANVLDYWVSLPQISVVILILVAFSAIALNLSSNNLLMAQILWLVGCFLAVGAAVYFSNWSELAYLFSVIPIIAAMLMGWQYGAVTTAGLLLIFWLLPPGKYMPVLPAALSLVVFITGLIGGLVTWSYLYSMRIFYTWAMNYYQRARDEMETGRTERIRFLEIQEDLELANTELKRMTDQLDILYQRAEEARRAKEEFVANVSHELRTPLNMIIGFSDVIMKNPRLYGGDIPGALLADIASIHRNSQHLSRLVDDVLDLSQVGAHRMAITKDWSAIQDIIKEAVSAVQALYDSKGLYLEAELADQYPPIFCDSTRIRQVVINLLSNAGRYTETGGIVVRAWPEEKNMIISVRDTGPGISTEDQAKIFQPFQQLGDAAQQKGGSGLGLAISQQFVEMHDGEMWVESELGVGSTFLVSIPIRAYARANGHPAANDDFQRFFRSDEQYEARTRDLVIAAPVAKPLFMLVENENTLQRLFERYMDEVEVVTKQSFAEAVDELSHTPIQALILNTPETSEGVNPENEIKNLPLGTPVFSCWVPGRDEVARELGVVDYLLKPVTQDEIIAAIQDLGTEIRRVLLIDDEPELLQLFTRMLSAANPEYQILQAFEGQRALNIMRNRRPDVILMDLIMPGVDGFQILREKRRDAAIRDIPTIVVSSINPTGETIISNNLTVTRKEGLSVPDLIGCIQSVNKVLGQRLHSSTG
jgi:signal transduction histidine kinase/CheY-like chemotaxis protein